MNSEEEKKLFESYGWSYNSIDRQWVAPASRHGKVIITQDDLMEYTTNPEGEQLLRDYIKAYGNPRKA